MGGGTKLFIVLVCAAALYSLAGFFGVPYAVQSLLPDYLVEKLQIDMEVGSASFNPYTFKLTVQDVTGETSEPGEMPDQAVHRR